ncbi:MAG: hypothetical protein J3R72DRAFT_61279 [Linnemannia gamsii]|nr:MAG: hypothetical protein J3R72DRAFT_61279 [Linnemannia gamsii]
MGKLTSLLKKKKTKGDDLGGQRTGSTMTGSSISVETSGIPAIFTSAVVVAPLSLSIPTTEITTTETQAPFSLMDDIMDELAGTSPDTPQPSQPTDLNDFGLAFELSRQLELGASESKAARNGALNQKIGKLDQNSAFKHNAFLQQARSGTSTTPAVAAVVAGAGVGTTPYRSTHSSTNGNTNNNASSTFSNQNSSTTGSTAATATSTTTTTTSSTTTATPSYLRGRPQTKGAEETTSEAAARLREASKKANAQLPSDDEGSDASDSDDSQYVPGFKKQQRLLQQQQYEHQLFLEQQQILQQQLGLNKSPEELELEEEAERRPLAINHEAVIDRMKDRHRALLHGAAAAAREEYYEDYRDEYGMMIPPQQMQSPGVAVMNYNMQYGMDPSVIYADDYRIQQQQQQMYFAQGGIPVHHPHAHINTSTYNHHSMNGMVPGYGYAHPSGPMPSYNSGIQTPVYQQQQHQHQQQQGSGRGTPMSHIPGILQSRSNSMMSDGSVPNSDSRRGSVQNSIVSSARVSEDSWNDAQQPQQQQHHHGHQHSMSTLSTQKSANSDSGYSGVASDQGKNTFDDSLEDIHTSVGSEYEKTKTKLDDVTKVIDVLSIAQATEKDSDGDDEEEDSDSSSDSDSDDSESDDSESDNGKSQGSDLDGQDEDPESLKGSTVIDSIRHGFKGITTGSSSAPSNNGSNEDEDEDEDENENDSSDDDQPIILSRRNSARGCSSNPTKVSAEEAAMISQAQTMMPLPQQQQQQHQQVPLPTSNAHMQYMAATNTMNMYQQPIQAQMHMSYMPQQQQQPQQIMSPQQQHQQLSQQQQQPYIPMGYQFPGPPQGVPTNMGHHHSYSVDRVPPSMMTQGPVARRVVGGGPGAPSKGHTSTGSSGSAIQSLYPIPATTLLHPLPRRSQSVRARPQAASPINNSNPNAAQGNGAAGAAAAAAGRGRSSLDFVRLSSGSGGYQSLIGGHISGPEFSSAGGVGVGGPYIRGYGGEPLSPPQQPQQQQQQQQPLPQHLQQHHQQMQQQMEKQQIQQGYYMGGNMMGGPLMSPPLPQYGGYMMQGDPYSAHPHQQMLQAGRR